MAFTIPNYPSAAYPAQAQPHQSDIDILMAGNNNVGVISGCAVTPSAAMVVAIAVGSVSVGTAYGSVAVATQTLASDPSNPRFTLVVANAAGVVSLIAGTPSANPVKPTIDVTTYAALAEVYIPAATTTITSGMITDKRVILKTVAIGTVPASRLVLVGHSYLAGGGASMADRGFGMQIAGMVGADIESFGVNGAEVGNDNTGANNTGNGGWAQVLQEPMLWATNRTAAPRQPNGFMGLTVYGANDILQHHGDASAGFNNGRTVFKNAMRTVISRLATSQIFEDASSTVVYGGGTWQAAVTNDIFVTALGSPWVTNLSASKLNSGASYRPFPANAAIFTITLPADFEGGGVAIGLIAYANSDATITWSGTCSAATGSISLAGQAYNSGGAGLQRSSNIGVVVRFNCLLADAGKTIIGTISGMAATTVATPSAPGAITHGGTPASTSYTYAWVSCNANGDTVESTTTNTATGAATLSAVNTNIIPAPGAFPAGVLAMKLIRTASAGTGNSGTLGLIAIITSNQAVTDTGYLAAAYVQATANPLVAGGAFDYWQAEAVTPSTVVLGCNQPRMLPGSLPLVGATGGYATGGGYVGGPAFGTTAITAGGGVAATTVTINYAGLTAAQQGFLIVGGIVNLTGGANPTEAFYINAINVGTGVITLSNLSTSQAGAVTQSGHTTVGYGYASDADVLNYNTDLQSVCNEFPSSVQYVDLDALITLNQSHYYLDGLHLNDRGWAIAAAAVAKTFGQVVAGLQPYQLAAMGRGRRRPENLQVFKRSQNSVPFITDQTLNNVAWANVTDTNGAIVGALIGAKAGDWLEIALSAVVNNAAVNLIFDAATMQTTSVVNRYCSLDSPTPNLGVGTWYAPGSAQVALSGSMLYQVQPSDLITSLSTAGLVLVQLRFQSGAATNRTLYMNSWPLVFTVKNLGEPSLFGGSP